MKVFFDTNVYVSEALTGGLAERLINTCLEARVRLYVSEYVLDEVQHVLLDRFKEQVSSMSGFARHLSADGLFSET